MFRLAKEHAVLYQVKNPQDRCATCLLYVSLGVTGVKRPKNTLSELETT